MNKADTKTLKEIFDDLKYYQDTLDKNVHKIAGIQSDNRYCQHKIDQGKAALLERLTGSSDEANELRNILITWESAPVITDSSKFFTQEPEWVSLEEGELTVETIYAKIAVALKHGKKVEAVEYETEQWLKIDVCAGFDGNRIVCKSALKPGPIYPIAFRIYQGAVNELIKMPNAVVKRIKDRIEIPQPPVVPCTGEDRTPKEVNAAIMAAVDKALLKFYRVEAKLNDGMLRGELSQVLKIAMTDSGRLNVKIDSETWKRAKQIIIHDPTKDDPIKIDVAKIGEVSNAKTN